MGLYLGIDLGTQSVKVLVFDTDLRTVVARASHDLPAPTSPRPGAAEQNPADWWEGFISATQKALATEGVDRTQVRAIGVSGQQHGMVVLDESGEVLHPAKLWCDVEPEAEARALSEEFGRAVPPGFTAPKLMWLKKHHPDLFAQATKLQLPHDWLNGQLTGNHATDAGDASGNGIFDPIARTHDFEAATWIDARVPDMLPPILAHNEGHGSLLPEIAEQLGLSTKVRVSAGSGDNMMSALGAGAFDPDLLVISLGTSGTLFGYSPLPIVDPNGEVAPFCDATGGWLPLVCTQNCTTVPNEVQQAFGMSHEELVELARKEPVGCEGMVFLPYLTGERTPNWPHATGVLHGIQPGGMRPGLLYRAALEGASFALAHGVQRLQDLGLITSRVQLVGGGAANPLWQEILASLLHVEIQLGEESESAALGAALHAATMDTGIKSSRLTPAASDPRLIAPITSDSSAYADAFENYQRQASARFG
ncbi:MAG: xylulokinase [Planctomycetes bacterium]|nr:xylulokinase [Planctomycetota bacterium]